MSISRTRAATLILFASLSCHRRTEIGSYLAARLDASSADAPGVACYAADAQLLRAVAAITTPARHERRWLLLDTMPAEGRGPEFRVAYLVTPSGIDLPVYGTWRRVGRHIDVWEGSAFPPARWELTDHDTVLVGEGVMQHDVMMRDSAGRFVSRVSRWPARAVRISCRSIPR
jgi:hypothetical protein